VKGFFKLESGQHGDHGAPKGVKVWSWDGHQMRSFGDTQVMKLWLQVRDANEALLDILQGHSFVAVRYEDIAADPPRALSRILNPLGLEFEDRQLDWARLPHHNLGGNRMRFSGNGELREDDSWRRTMAPELVERVDRATAKLEARIAECM